ncbi:GOLPH3/VPS74 family protein [Nonomuraea aridisoli]|uniref:GPP34 family phosphoprotein n=1 Tax=Nonomuraea aridisoli TaxID=2070368 RepID=A0A2W2DKE9_9ACTN|nr:GPP34 family phosphoprotein [Nonomuraea aridisoli]PZG12402.1 GPP34 family phosphoprotein [Nonomuraea aridisoli]
MMVTIAEELLLLALSEDKGRPLVSTAQLDPALAGALLAELAVGDRVELSDKKVTVKDPSPLGDDELDAVLARVVAQEKVKSPVWWVQKLQSGKLRQRLLSRLAALGVLSEERGKVLGVFPVTRWPEAHPGVEADVRERVSAVLAGADPDARTAVLISVAHAASVVRKAFPDADKARVKEIAEGAWAADAVAKTIAAATAAAMTAVMAATVTTAAS